MNNDQKTQHASGASLLNVGLGDVFVPEPCPTNKELLALIGEIDGIDLESEGYGIVVYLHIGNKKIKIIHGSGENISHHITRTGIACCIGVPNV